MREWIRSGKGDHGCKGHFHGAEWEALKVAVAMTYDR
jgi:hypothetical protein